MQGRKPLLKMILAQTESSALDEKTTDFFKQDLSSYNLDEQNSDGNTLLHIFAIKLNVHDDYKYQENKYAYFAFLIKQLLENGANSRLKNKKGETFVDILFYLDVDEMTPNHLFFTSERHFSKIIKTMFSDIQRFCQSSVFLLPYLNKLQTYKKLLLGCDGPSPKEIHIYNVINLHDLCEKDLKTLLNWHQHTFSSAPETSTYRWLIKYLQSLIHYVKIYPGLNNVIRRLTDPLTKFSMFRVMLLDTTGHLSLLLNELVERIDKEKLPLDRNLRAELIEFAKSYKQVSEGVMGTLSTPAPLMADEQMLHIIFEDLEFSMTHKIRSEAIRDFREKTFPGEIDNMCTTYGQYQSHDASKRQAVVLELKQNKDHIKKSTFLSEHSKWAIRQQKCESEKQPEHREFPHTPFSNLMSFWKHQENSQNQSVTYEASVTTRTLNMGSQQK